DKGIDSLEEYLSEYGFLRTHRCYLVNYRFIKSISESVHLKNGTAIPMARKRKKIIEEEIRKVILRDMMRY
ncbi:MAG: LytTR family transcriptional regulator, partial [Lachnospiraceae bacterium]|nr:LytTR family transcriptional regulator [Lachnospiraceae bacterium]